MRSSEHGYCCCCCCCCPARALAVVAAMAPARALVGLGPPASPCVHVLLAFTDALGCGGLDAGVDVSMRLPIVEDGD